MTDTSTELEGLVDTPNLTAWLDEHVPDLGSGPLVARKIHGGTSNVVLSLNRGGESVVLRRPPAVPPPNSERAIMREATILEALNATDVPHPFCHGRCEDPEVIGAPFYVMDLIDGWSAELRGEHIDNPAPFDEPPYEYRVPFAIADALVALANVDYKAIGLGDYGKPDRFLERQVDRWKGQLESYEKLYGHKRRELPGYDKAEAWLRENVPATSQPGILHGDVSTTNSMFSRTPPTRVIALIDWELSTIGDPLLDLAWFSNGLRDERWPDEAPGSVLYNYQNMPTRQELARYYASGTGRDVSNFDYYLVLALFKAGCLLEYKVAQAHAGHLPEDVGKLFAGFVETSFTEAERLIDATGM